MIENDIGWRVNTMVDFAASRMPAINSTAKDPQIAVQLNGVIAVDFEELHGGVKMLQNRRCCMGQSADAYAWVQHVRPTAALLARLGNENSNSTSGGGAEAAPNDLDNASTKNPADAGGVTPLCASDWFCFEIVEAGRLCPLPLEGGGGYAAVLNGNGEQAAPARNAGLMERVRNWFAGGSALIPSPQNFSFDLFGASYWQRYVNGMLTEQGVNPLGVLPFVRYENQADPAAEFAGGGGGQRGGGYGG